MTTDDVLIALAGTLICATLIWPPLWGLFVLFAGALVVAEAIVNGRPNDHR